MINKVISVSSPRTLGKLLNFMPRELIDWKKHAAFRQVVRYAYKNSQFYRRKFDELKIDPNKIRKPSDLGSFYTTPIDIIEHAEEFLCKKPQLVFESSGTTGRNKRIYLSQREIDNVGKFMATGLYMGGVTKDDRLVNGLDFCIWIPGMITQKCIEKSGLFGMAAGKVDPIEVYKRLATYKFSVIMGEPTWLIRLTEIAEKNGSYPLKFLIGGAEAMPDAARPWMEKVWPGAKVIMVYATVESAGIIGFELFKECVDYHIDENSFFVEISDQGDDGYGEVTFTTLSRTTMPLIRYRNRDISKIIEEKCACGLPFRKLARIRGRSDEMIVASGGNLYPLMFEEIFKNISGISSDWQIIFKLRGIKEVMEYNLELKGPEAKDAIKEHIFLNIQNFYPDLWKNYLLGIFEMDFVYHEPGKIREGKHKLIRLVDKRYVK